MNLETQIRPELWQAIADSYDSKNYAHAIKDAMVFVTEMLRDKSGLDGDGVSLAGNALSLGKSGRPMIQINSLQTQTEKDMQEGLKFSLMGLYALVRNPRSHERLQDTKKDADVIIAFIDYCLGFLGPSQQSFTVQGFLKLVEDPHFVSSQLYVSDLVDLVPVRKRGDTLVALYRRLDWGNSDKIEKVVRELLPRLSDGEIEGLLQVISDDFLETMSVNSISLVLKVFPGDLWPRLQRMPRLRAEKMLLGKLKDARYRLENNHAEPSACTWMDRIAGPFTQKPQLRTIIVKKLRSDDFEEHDFVARYFLATDALPEIFGTEPLRKRCVAAIASSIRSGNRYMKGYNSGIAGQQKTDETLTEIKPASNTLLVYSTHYDIAKGP